MDPGGEEAWGTWAETVDGGFKPGSDYETTCAGSVGEVEDAEMVSQGEIRVTRNFGTTGGERSWI